MKGLKEDSIIQYMGEYVLSLFLVTSCVLMVVSLRVVIGEGLCCQCYCVLMVIFLRVVTGEGFLDWMKK